MRLGWHEHVRCCQRNATASIHDVRDVLMQISWTTSARRGCAEMGPSAKAPRASPQTPNRCNLPRRGQNCAALHDFSCDAHVGTAASGRLWSAAASRPAIAVGFARTRALPSPELSRDTLFRDCPHETRCDPVCACASVSDAHLAQSAIQSCQLLSSGTCVRTRRALIVGPDSRK